MQQCGLNFFLIFQFPVIYSLCLQKKNTVNNSSLFILFLVFVHIIYLHCMVINDSKKIVHEHLLSSLTTKFVYLKNLMLQQLLFYVLCKINKNLRIDKYFLFKYSNIAFFIFTYQWFTIFEDKDSKIKIMFYDLEK